MLNLDNLFSHIDRHVHSFWPEFSLVAFALYDTESVYLYNHPEFSSKHKSYYYMKWNEKFNGANTLILFEGFPTAIVNLKFYNNIESIYPIVIHELFHGFQHLQGEKRFPDEVSGITYPLLAENIELRNRERSHLDHAVFSAGEEKISYLNKFIRLREMRRSFIDTYLDYELSIETIEGPAYYMELLAYIQISNCLFDEVLREYGKGLTNEKESSYFLRKSCYSSGLFLCLLLDQISPDWKKTFFNTDKTLYEMVKEKVERKSNDHINFDISKETLLMIDKIGKDKSNAFQTFEYKEGYHLHISGDMVSKTFDPMNIMAIDNKQLHNHFITVRINNREYHISQPVIAYYKDKFNKINKLHVVLDEKPVIQNGFIHISGIGQIPGSLFEKEGEYFIDLQIE